jgi:hypothetical protein
MVLDARGWKSEWKYKITWNGVVNVNYNMLPRIVFVFNKHMPLAVKK